MDKARALTLFLGVARAGSFSQAAINAGLTPQATSKAVRQLEEHLGVRLLHRTTRKLSLTDEGARLFELADPGLRLLDEALDLVRHSKEEMDGLIRLAAPPSVGNRVLVPLIRDFRNQYPDAQFDLLLDDHFTDLVQARIDVGFRAGTAPERNLVARRLRQIGLTICASPDYLERHGTPTSLRSLLAHSCTGYRHPNTGRILPWELNVNGTLAYQDVPAVVSFNNAEAEVEAVVAGIGIGQLQDYLIGRELRSGALVPLLPKLGTARLALFMYYPQRKQMPLRVRRFVDFVADAAQRRVPHAPAIPSR